MTRQLTGRLPTEPAQYHLTRTGTIRVGLDREVEMIRSAPRTSNEEALSALDAKLTVEAFVRWLQHRDPNEQVGRACRGADCPLHTWVQTLLPEGGTLRVTGSAVKWLPYGSHRYLTLISPMWMEEFVRQVDQQFGDNGLVLTHEAIAIALRLVD